RPGRNGVGGHQCRIALRCLPRACCRVCDAGDGHGQPDVARQDPKSNRDYLPGVLHVNSSSWPAVAAIFSKATAERMVNGITAGRLLECDCKATNCKLPAGLLQDYYRITTGSLQ